ncbi:peptidoglycan DD-metalloendopeptidase family protein [Deinococcus roseus]|uniref:Peptidase M23 n=1 Tax=Deinococcus roseus TaxID=392414 RepID=A0ABQ2DIT8_9DEIO|nr:M23 family metallopeptidase [Deinococcus roseus]GGJ58082.1 peptidase M23 [Deinococcus roseus]
MKFQIKTLLITLSLLGLAQAGDYTVKSGDTLSRIAQQFGITVQDLKSANNLTSDIIRIGQVLDIPGLSDTETIEVGKLSVTLPKKVWDGQAFSVRLRGEDADKAIVRFLSEVSEDVREPAEYLKSVAIKDREAIVLGRVVLGNVGKTIQIEIAHGEKVNTLEIPVTVKQATVRPLNLSPEVAAKLNPTNQSIEDKVLNKVYAMRTPQQWTKAFQDPGVKAVSAGFGTKRIYKPGEPVKYHYGSDFPAKTGTPVYAVNDGTVVVAAKYEIRGNLVVIDHGLGVQSLYFHQSKLLVKVGDTVQKGQKIGEVGTTGLSTGPHLHWEMRVRGEATNPQEWVGKIYP